MFVGYIWFIKVFIGSFWKQIYVKQMKLVDVLCYQEKTIPTLTTCQHYVTRMKSGSAYRKHCHVLWSSCLVGGNKQWFFFVKLYKCNRPITLLFLLKLWNGIWWCIFWIWFWTDPLGRPWLLRLGVSYTFM